VNIPSTHHAPRTRQHCQAPTTHHPTPTTPTPPNREPGQRQSLARPRPRPRPSAARQRQTERPTPLQDVCATKAVCIITHTPTHTHTHTHTHTTPHNTLLSMHRVEYLKPASTRLYVAHLLGGGANGIPSWPPAKSQQSPPKLAPRLTSLARYSPLPPHLPPPPAPRSRPPEQHQAARAGGAQEIEVDIKIDL
jgi:hypothetical protein